MGMYDETLCEPVFIDADFVDGFTDHEVRNGYLRCTGYRLDGDQKIVVLRIVMPANVVLECQARARAALGGLMVNQVVSTGDRLKLLN